MKEYYVRYRKSNWNKTKWNLKVAEGDRKLVKLVKKLLKEDNFTSIWIDDGSCDEFEDLWFYRNMYDLQKQRPLIKKFDNEFSKEYHDKHPEVAGAMPDVEEVYKRYYELKEKLNEK